jgi:hypothetical protein
MISLGSLGGYLEDFVRCEKRLLVVAAMVRAGLFSRPSRADAFALNSCRPRSFGQGEGSSVLLSECQVRSKINAGCSRVGQRAAVEHRPARITCLCTTGFADLPLPSSQPYGRRRRSSERCGSAATTWRRACRQMLRFNGRLTATLPAKPASRCLCFQSIRAVLARARR